MEQAQWDRLTSSMDEQQRTLARLVADVEVLKHRTSGMETRQGHIEARLDEINERLAPAATWQTWAMLVGGLVMFVLVVIILTRVTVP